MELLMPATSLEELMQRGLHCQRQGRFAEAKDLYAQILREKPDHGDALHMLGMIAGMSGLSAISLDLLERAAAVTPNSSEVHNNLGNVLRDLGRIDDALAAYSRAIELRPDYAGAHRNLGNVLNDQGRPEEAVKSFRRAVGLEPNSAEIHSSLLYSLHFNPEYDSKALLAEHRQWNRKFAKPLAQHIRPFGNDRNPDRKLKVAYLSPDFQNHPVGRLLRPLFANHDHQRFEIWAYSDVIAPDETTKALRGMVDRWHGIMGMPHEALADKINRDRIDILVDLTQHSGNNRMPLFARKPAPVQVAWLGYPCTTGLDAMDYRLTDPHLDPPGRGDEFYSEKSYRLPHCYWCYEPSDGTQPLNAPPAQANGFVTFGSMNRFAKVTMPTLQLWRKILQAVPNSRMIIHSKIGDHLNRVKRFFAEGGIDAGRVEFVERKGVQEYMRQYHRLDICLDPIPHGGGTTTCDALYMGVAVVTLSGKTAVGRGGASILNNVGLQEFVAETPEKYVAIAAELAGDVERLASLRQQLRGRLQASPLMNGRQFASDMEAAFRFMWKIYCESIQNPSRIV